jgi:hypothetical protein
MIFLISAPGAQLHSWTFEGRFLPCSFQSSRDTQPARHLHSPLVGSAHCSEPSGWLGSSLNHSREQTKPSTMFHVTLPQLPHENPMKVTG